MRKLLAVTLSWALLTPSLAQAEFLKDLKFNGEVEVQMISMDNATDFSSAANDQFGAAWTRVLLGASMDLLDDVSARVTLVKNNRVWGDNTATIGPATGFNTGTEDVDNLTANIGVDEAWFKIDDLMGKFSLTLGRQYYGNPGDLIVYFGPARTPGHLLTSSLDVAKVESSGDMLSFTGIAGKLTGTNPISGALPPYANTDLQGVELGFKGLPLDLGLFAYRRLVHDTAASPSKGDELFIPGLRLKGDMDDMFYSLTFAKNFGKNRNGFTTGTGAAAGQSYDGWGLVAKAGMKFNLEGMAMLKPSVEYGRGSGDDPATAGENEGFRTVNSDYKPGELVGLFSGLGLFGVTGYGGYNVGLLNTSVWSVGVEAVPEAAPKLTASLRYWDSELVETAGPGINNEELDLRLSWAHSDNVTLNAVLADGGPTGIFRSNSARLYKGEVAVRF